MSAAVSTVGATEAAAPARTPRQAYRDALTWACTLFNSVRLLAYVPTLMALLASGDSSQHSLWTWTTWVGANLSMAAWLYEHNGHRVNAAVALNFGCAVMCLLTLAAIVVYRHGP